MHPSIAFLHDFLLVPGGAEQFALHVKERFTDLDGFCGFIDPEAFPDRDIGGLGFRTLTSPSRVQGWQGIKSMRAFEARCGFLRRYDSVVYSGIYSPFALQHHAEGRNIHYCHTPPRFLYDLKAYYLDRASLAQKVLLNAFIRYYQPRYETAIRAMDVVVANSANVRARLERYVGVSEAMVIHPPVSTDDFQWLEQGDYYVSTARLEPYKRVELVVRAFMQMPDKKLVVASGGSQLEALRKLADGHHHIHFTGWCSKAELRKWIGAAIATVYVPLDEDFGMSPIESMAAGKPVIGVAEGGLLETIVAEETGVLIDPIAQQGDEKRNAELAIEQIVDAVRALGKDRALSMRQACAARAERFSDRVFDEKFTKLLKP